MKNVAERDLVGNTSRWRWRAASYVDRILKGAKPAIPALKGASTPLLAPGQGQRAGPDWRSVLGL